MSIFDLDDEVTRDALTSIGFWTRDEYTYTKKVVITLPNMRKYWVYGKYDFLSSTLIIYGEDMPGWRFEAQFYKNPSLRDIPVFLSKRNLYPHLHMAKTPQYEYI